MCEIFVASLYVQNSLKELAKPCWQMVYLSLFTLPLIILLSHYTGTLVLTPTYQSAGLSYYKISLYSIPLIGIITSICGFFVGQGKVKLVLCSTLTINVINLGLDFILIFGISGYIPALGAEGAALSAVISLSIQALWLITIFLNKKHRSIYNTHDMRFNFSYFKKSLRVGAPIALNHACEILGWLIIIRLIAQTGLKNFTLISIGSTIYLVYAFINDGLSRTLGTIISNHLSAKNFLSISKSLNHGTALLLLFIMLLAIPMLIEPNIIIHLFNLKNYAQAWHHDIKISFIFIWLYFLFAGLYWVYASTLIATQHTKFIMIGNLLSIWILSVLPFYILTNYYTLPSFLIWPIMCLYVFISCISIFIYYFRKVRYAW
jgi:MATE family multidrug resistance protein